MKQEDKFNRTASVTIHAAAAAAHIAERHGPAVGLLLLGCGGLGANADCGSGSTSPMKAQTIATTHPIDVQPRRRLTTKIALRLR